MTILTRAAGPHRVGRVMSIIGVPMLLGPILGPILGGWLVDDASWRWIFFINVPIGIFSLVMASRILPRDTAQPQHGFDALGASIGTAVMTVILTNALADRAPEPAAAAGAFGETFAAHRDHAGRRARGAGVPRAHGRRVHGRPAGLERRGDPRARRRARPTARDFAASLATPEGAAR
jgi:hypothetical protein